MVSTPIEHLASLRIGTVEYISPDRIEVQLDIESPDSVALNTGTPRNFPRINSYVNVSSMKIIKRESTDYQRLVQN